MVGAHQNLNGSRDLARPLSKIFANYGLTLAMIILSTKFKVYFHPSALYEDLKGYTKCEKWGGLE